MPSAPTIEVVDPELFDPSVLSASEKAVYQSIRPYLNYLNRDLRFDARNTEHALARLGLTFPKTGEDFLRTICRRRLDSLAVTRFVHL